MNQQGPAVDSGSCAAEACCHASPSPAISLNEALQRWQRETTRGTCDTGRYRCPYVTWGDGPPLVLIPGLSDQALSFVMLCAHLSKHFRCIAYDLPVGKEDGARLRRYAHADLVNDLMALLDHLRIHQSYVLGASFGSTIALAALHGQAARFPRGILQGGFAHRPLAPAEVVLASLARYWPWPMRRLPFRRPLLRRAHGEPFVARAPEEWEFFLERWGCLPMAAVAQRACLLHRLDVRPLLRDIRQPVLLVCGDRDPLVSRNCETALLNELPQAARVEIGGCGHNPQYSHPEALAAIVQQFLTPPACG